MTETTMRRRLFLAAVGTVCTTTIAGCSGGDEDGSNPTENPAPSSTATTPNEQAVEHYERAIEELVKNKEQHDQWVSDEFEGDAVNFLILRDRLETARAELDEAEPAASSPELIRQIDQARLVAVIQELRIAYNDGTVTVARLIEDGKTLGSEQENHQNAADKFAEAKSLIDDLRRVLDDFEQGLNDLDQDTLDEPELDYSGDPLDYFVIDDRRRLDAGESYADAYMKLNLTFVKFYEGTTHWEGEQWGEARNAWETARTYAEEGLISAQSVIDNDHSPDAYHNDAIELRNGLDTGIEALDKFVEGGKEAENGNVERGKQLVNEGFNILNEG